MEVQIASITPIRERQEQFGQGTEEITRFEVGLTRGVGENTTVSVSAETAVDFQKCRIAIAERTGCLLVKKGEWDAILSNAWQDAKPATPEDEPFLKDIVDASEERDQDD